MTELPPDGVVIGELTFDRTSYNAWVGELTLARGTKPPLVADQFEPVRDHCVRFDEDGEVARYTILYPDLFLARDGELRFHLPDGTTVALTREQAAALLVDPNAARDARRRRREAMIWHLQLGGRLHLPRRLRGGSAGQRRRAARVRRQAAGS